MPRAPLPALPPMVLRVVLAVVGLVAIGLVVRALTSPKRSAAKLDAPLHDAADTTEAGLALDRAAFAEEMADAVREATPDSTVQVDDERFVLEWEKGDEHPVLRLDMGIARPVQQGPPCSTNDRGEDLEQKRTPAAYNVVER